MDFKRLPEEAILLILSYVPLKERIRLGRVNRYFQEKAILSISETKNLDLSHSELTPKEFSIILNLCHQNLKKINFPDGATDLIEIFARFSASSSLTDLEIGYADIGNPIFGKLVNNHPNLQNLTWRMVYDINWLEFPDTICEKLQRLVISRCNNDSFRSLTGRCPNLIHFEVTYIFGVSSETLDEFFRSCPKLEVLKISRMEGIKFSCENLNHFWKLPLRKLTICCDPDRPITDSVLKKISASFLGLVSLDMRFLSVTNQGASALANLENLRNLSLAWIRGDIDEAVRRIASMGRLKKANFDFNMTPTTFLTLLRFCHDLRFLSVHSITQIDTSAEAYAIVKKACLSGKETVKKSVITKEDRNLTISIHDRDTAEIWISLCVQDALDLIKRVDGRVIKIVHKDFM